MINSDDNTNLEKKSCEPVKNGERRGRKLKKPIKKSAATCKVKKERQAMDSDVFLNSDTIPLEQSDVSEQSALLNGNYDGSPTISANTENEIKILNSSTHLTKKNSKIKDNLDDSVDSKQDEMSESEKALISSDKITEKEETAEWVPGDLVWAHMTGYPWWPGLIEDDPIRKMFTKIQGKGRWYHVQFFGVDVVRGWVKSVMEYKGESHYLQQMKDCSSHASRKSDARARRMSWFEVKPSRLSTWKAAVAEAEEAFLCDREERRIKFGVEYFDVPSKDQTENLSPEKKRQTRRKISKTEDAITKLDNKNYPNSSSTPLVDSKDEASDTDHSCKDDVVEESLSDRNASPNRNKKTIVYQTEGNFNIFLEKCADKVKQQNPHFTDDALEKFLQEQWEEMTVQQRSRYISPFDNVESTADVGLETTAIELSPNPEKMFRKRAHKPSQRFLEAAVSNLYPSPRASKKSPKSSPTSVQKSNKEIISEKAESLLLDKAKWSIEKQFTKVDLTTGDDLTCVVSHLSEDLPVETESCPSVSSLGSNASSRSSAETRYDKICQVCLSVVVSGNKNFVKCEGACNSSFHKNCLNLTTKKSTFTCSECTSGIHTCFACKEKSQDTQKCYINQCGRFYHESCTKKYPAAQFNSKGFICPLHMCVSCLPDAPWKDHIVHRGRMVRCIRCPTAYHFKDSCLAAGTEILTSSSMLCPSHYDKKQRQRIKQINVNWCFICSSGGSLICCESCPAAFHAECLHIDPPEGNYYCRDCALGRQPKFGDIVWVKLGCYRWWPARILHPKSVPENIQALNHQIGEFPVEFFGSHDYYWTNRSRVFLYQEGDKGNENASSRALAKTYEKALREATAAFVQWKELKETRDDKNRINQKPPPFKSIKTNKPVGKVQTLTIDPWEFTPCECKPSSENPCSSESDCLNRMVMFECNLAMCPAGEKCCNQRFQKRLYAETEYFKAGNKGWGLRSLTDISKGQFVIEYVGELIDEDECKNRMKKMHEMDKTDYYFLTLDKDRIIDAGQKGNYARFMNHSCQPNCETQKWTVNGDTRVGLFAICDIPSGTELTFNYYLDCLENEKRPCHCQTPVCSGYIGVRPKIASNGSVPSDVKKTNELKKKKTQKIITEKKDNGEIKKDSAEDECFYCKDGGELILCDRPNCPKAYHLRCVKISDVPNGVWECPWHNCDVCSEPSMLLCADCPSSFCQLHHAHSIAILPGGRVVCRKHVSRKRKVESDSEIEIKDEVTEMQTSVKRRPGRPRKLVKNENDISCADKGVEKINGRDSDSDVNPTPRRGPGRPRKIVLTDDHVIEKKMKREDGEAMELKSDETNKINDGLRNIFKTISAVPTSAEKNLAESVSVIKEIEISEVQDESMVKKEKIKSARKAIKRKFRSESFSLRSHKRGKAHRTRNIQRSRIGAHSRAPVNSKKRAVGRPKKSIISSVEKITSANQNGESSSSKDEDETTAIITVETDGISDIGLKPFVQKYKLENGEFSLEECEYSENVDGTILTD